MPGRKTQAGPGSLLASQPSLIDQLWRVKIPVSQNEGEEGMECNGVCDLFHPVGRNPVGVREGGSSLPRQRGPTILFVCGSTSTEHSGSF